MGAVPAKIPDARSSRLAASNFNDGCPVQKLELNLWRVDINNVSIWPAFGHIHLMQAPRRRAYGCSIDTVHPIKMNCDKPVSGNAILDVSGEKMPRLESGAASMCRALNAVAHFPGKILDMRSAQRVFWRRRTARKCGEHPG